MSRNTKNNPFTRVFGKEPAQSVTRLSHTEEILSELLSEMPGQQIFMVTGVRGSGKTVLMTEICTKIRAEKDWIVVELNPAKDMLTGLASKLYEQKGVAKIIDAASINLSAFGIGVGMSGSRPVTDIEVAIERILAELKKKKKRVLVAIDEAASTEEMRVFASAFQIFIRQDYPLFLIMTGLYENIDELQNNKILTFLYRAPKIRMTPLNIGGVAMKYKDVFGFSEEDSRAMAGLTLGYPFAFQVLGYYTFERNGDYKGAITDTRQYLEEYVYDKIWSELSVNDKRVMVAIAGSTEGKTAEIRKQVGMETNIFSTYRERLIKKGVINGETRGYVKMALPFFREFVLDREAEMEAM